MNNKSRSTLFLMELLISILFFSLACSVCVQMFVKSHLLSRESTEMNHSVIWCESFAEAFYGCEANIDEIKTVLGSKDNGTGPSTVIVFYDDDFNSCDRENATYSVLGELSGDNDLLSFNITCTNIPRAQSIYNLSLVYYPYK